MKSEKFFFTFNLVIRAVLVIAIIATIFEQNWLFVFLGSLALLLTFFPKIVERRYKIELPISLQIIIVLFIYAGVFLGGVRNFYERFWWWDSMLHFISGIGLGFAGFLFLYVLYKKGKIERNPGLIAFLSFCFALSLGALWEIFEFSIDSFFGYNMQRARDLCSPDEICDTRLGVIDTMIDLILNTIGALIASAAGYLYLKTGGIPVFRGFVEKFEKKNPNLFK